MDDVPPALRAEIVDRAGNRCEYCQLSQVGQEATFHVDHVAPRAAGGLTVIENLPLACVSCSLRKGARQYAVNPETGNEVPLYNPRTQSWDHHFRWDAEWIVALTPTGLATITALALNRPLIGAIRREEIERGRHPPE